MIAGINIRRISKVGNYMKEIIYNKLVRDKIPQIIEASGKTCETEVLSDERYLEMLDKKLNEELAECAGNCIKNHNSYHKSYNKEIFERKRK